MKRDSEGRRSPRAQRTKRGSESRGSVPARPPSPPGPRKTNWARLWLWCFGLWLALAVIKFGNPIVLEQLVEVPRGLLALQVQSWPAWWGMAGLGLLAAAGIPLCRFKRDLAVSVWAVPLAWLLWQLWASARTVDASLSGWTLVYFGACVVCYYVGLYAVSRFANMNLILAALLVGFVYQLWIGFTQHFGGLEATREMIYQQGDLSRYSPEFMAKIASDRIFSTLVYPNAFAGSILLLFPPLLYACWNWTDRWGNVPRGVGMGIFAYMALACLYWSGSKAGWLIALVLGGIWLVRVPYGGLKLKVALLSLLMAVGLAGFFYKYSDYFQEGATSVEARFDYWEAAWETALDHPFLGTGPGTFSIPYAKIKDPEAEMARLAHNDYLEQASDSGFPGMLIYLAFWPGFLAWLAGKCWGDPMRFAVWLGLVGWALQGMVEFGLYIPSLAWPAFLLLGLLWTWEGKPVDKQAGRR